MGGCVPGVLPRKGAAPLCRRGRGRAPARPPALHYVAASLGALLRAVCVLLTSDFQKGQQPDAAETVTTAMKGITLPQCRLGLL